jgi:hypothetical protein
MGLSDINPAARMTPVTRKPVASGGSDWEAPKSKTPFAPIAGSHQAGPPQPTPLPGLDLGKIMANISGSFGGGTAGSAGGAAGGAAGMGAASGSSSGGGAGADAPNPQQISTFQGSPNTYLEEVYRKAMEQYANVPDMYNRNITQARDAVTGSIKEASNNLMGRLGSGAASPMAFNRIGDMASRGLNAAAIDSAGQVFDRRNAALALGGTAGNQIAQDLRAQEGMGIGAYDASTRAYTAAQNASIARERMSLEAQIAQMNAMMGLASPFINAYASAVGGMYGGYGGGAENIYGGYGYTG